MSSRRYYFRYEHGTVVCLPNPDNIWHAWWKPSNRLPTPESKHTLFRSPRHGLPRIYPKDRTGDLMAVFSYDESAA
jgi:hypothetical protein